MTEALVQPVDPRIDDMIRKTAKAFGALLIARKDAKAVATQIQGQDAWIPDRESTPRGTDPNEGALIPFRLGDFRKHLLEKRCLGTYLLNSDNMVKFFAFDIDLSKADETIWYVVRDLTELEELRSKPQRQQDKILELDYNKGNLEIAFHDINNPAYRWARTIVYNSIVSLADIVRKQLGLYVMPVITGGGAHVIVPLPQLTPAVEARAAARAVMDETGMSLLRGDCFWHHAANPNSGITIEVFPKQDRLPDSGGFGNLIRLPLGYHSGAKIRTYFLDMDAALDVPAWELPRRSTMNVLGGMMTSLGMEL